MQLTDGRAQVVSTRAGVHLFGALSSDGTAANLVPSSLAPKRWQSRGRDFDRSCEGEVERLYLINTSVLEVLREEIAGPVGPLSIEAMRAATTRSRRSLHRLRVLANGADESDIFEIDLGQPLEFYAHSFDLELLSPAGVVAVPDNAAQSADTAQGTVYDSLIFAKGLAIEHTQGATEATLTDVVTVAAGVAATVPVPSRARSLEATMTDTGAYPPDMFWVRGDPAIGVPGAITIGRVPWQTSGRRELDELVVPNASHLQIDADLASGQDRVFTFTWRIRP